MHAQTVKILLQNQCNFPYTMNEKSFMEGFKFGKFGELMRCIHAVCPNYICEKFNLIIYYSIYIVYRLTIHTYIHHTPLYLSVTCGRNDVCTKAIGSGNRGPWPL